MDIAAGEFVSITGASGSGKSTMMHLLGCLDRPTSGRYFFKGQAINSFNAKQLARIRSQEIGFVFQTFNLINRTRFPNRRPGQRRVCVRDGKSRRAGSQ